MFNRPKILLDVFLLLFLTVGWGRQEILKVDECAEEFVFRLLCHFTGTKKKGEGRKRKKKKKKDREMIKESRLHPEHQRGECMYTCRGSRRPEKRGSGRFIMTAAYKSRLACSATCLPEPAFRSASLTTPESAGNPCLETHSRESV